MKLTLPQIGDIWYHKDWRNVNNNEELINSMTNNKMIITHLSDTISILLSDTFKDMLRAGYKKISTRLEKDKINA